MKKGSKILLIVSLLVILFGAGFIIYNYTQQSTYGFTTLSLSPNVQLNSNDPTIGGQAWILTVSQNGAGQGAYGTFTAESGSASSDPFTITTSLDENYALYTIQNTNVPIRQLQWTTTTYNPFGSLGGCNPDYWSYAFIEGGLFSKVWCYKYTTDGYYGTISSGNVNFQSSIKVQGKEGTDTCTISNTGSQSCYSNNNKFYVSWVGSLVSGQSIPNAANDGKIAVYKPSTSGWQIGSQINYNTYKTYDQTGFTSCLNLPVNGDVGSCFTKYNNYESQVLTPVSWSIVGGSNAITLGSQSNGKIQMNLPMQVQFPVLTMRVKASFIGINIPVGKPQIVSGSSQEFQTGQSGTIKVSVKNIGDGDGTFDVSATCTNGFSQTGNALRISSLSPGNTQIVYLPITANVQSGTSSGTCTVLAKDYNNPNNFDTKVVSVSASQLTICTEGDQRISGQNIQECQNNIWVTIKTCASDETPNFINGQLQCVKEGSPGSTTPGECSEWTIVPGFFGWDGVKIPDLFCVIDNFFTSIKWLVAVIGGLLAGLAGWKIGKKKFNKNSKMPLLIGLIVAVITGALILIFFWWGVLILVILGLIKWVVPGW